jgi:hypothetical protein
MITRGSLVQCNYNFDREREKFKYAYPKINDLLTVIKREMDRYGNHVLWFDELKIPVPLYEESFDEIQDEYDGDAILNEAFKIANNIG